MSQMESELAAASQKLKSMKDEATVKSLFVK